MNIAKKTFFCCLLLVYTFFIVSIKRDVINGKQYERSSHFALLNPDYDRKKIIVNSVIDSKPSRYISFITDGEQNHYVIKQKRNVKIQKQLRVVYEKLSAHIAETMEIPAHKVQILPAGMEFPGKIITEEPASILTLVPGISIKNIATHINIRQINNPILPQEQLGLNEKVIASMALHPDLVSITALDTFIGNDDRHGANLFYYEHTNRFYAIDMDKIHNVNDQQKLISNLACDQISSMLCDKKDFSQTELDGLKLYQNTLKRLVILFPPNHIHDLLDEFAVLGKFDKKVYLPELVNTVANIKKKVEQSHNYILELIDLLSELIKLYKEGDL